MKKDEAVSSVVSEMLLITLVLIMIPLVTISLMNQLPGEREPTVTIKMESMGSNEVILHHKGGDYLLWKEMAVIVSHSNTPKRISGDELKPANAKTTFDLGDTTEGISVSPGDKIQLIVKNTVIFSGVV